MKEMQENGFQGRRIAIASCHRKEEVLAPLLETSLGVETEVPVGLDTDQFGTFSGEIARIGSPLDAVRAKCRLANQQTGIDLVLASEGSFGPHPEFPWIAADQEWLLLIDFANQREYKVYHLDVETNFHSAEVRTEEELDDFCRKVFFPSHGLILRSGKEIYKGIQDRGFLEAVFKKLRSGNQVGQAETDMRAMMNPTRMKAIGKAGEKLVQLLLQTCPQCQAPGYQIAKWDGNLPCQWCLTPSRIPSHSIWNCESCGHTEKRKQPDSFADPAVCDVCNP